MIFNISSDECYIKLSIPGFPELFSINQTAFTIYQALGINTDLIREGFALTISPNPVSDKLNVSFTAEKSWTSKGIVEIYTAKGELVLSKAEGIKSSASQNIILGVKELPQGLYLLKLSFNGKTSSKKFIKR